MNNSPWGLKKYNRLFRLSGVVSRVLVAQKYCNAAYTEVHPLYEFLQEYMFNICANINMQSWLFEYDNLEPFGAELCDLFQKFIKENKQLTYKTDNRYKEFTKKYFPYVDQVMVLKRPYKEENEKLIKALNEMESIQKLVRSDGTIQVWRGMNRKYVLGRKNIYRWNKCMGRFHKRYSIKGDRVFYTSLTEETALKEVHSTQRMKGIEHIRKNFIFEPKEIKNLNNVLDLTDARVLKQLSKGLGKK